MDIQLVIEAIQLKARSLTDMKTAPDTIPEASYVFPFSVSYLRSFDTLLTSYQFTEAVCTIYTEFHLSRTLLGSSVEQGYGLITAFIIALRNDPALGAVADCISSIRGTFGKLEWANVQTIGVRFEITVKVSI